MYRSLLRPILFRLDPELSHSLGMMVLRGLGMVRPLAGTLRRLLVPRGINGVERLGLRFPSRLGMAAGFDKNASAVWGVWGLGFGFLEVGSVSARPWPENPPPRLHRLVREEGLINRMGLPSQGVSVIVPRLRNRPPFPVLVNVAKTADPSINGDAAVEDIRAGVQAVLPVADAVVLNLSCPNTEDGRTFEDPDALRELLAAVAGVRGPRRPILVKVSPDLPEQVLGDVVSVSLDAGVAGFVATNTTRGRDGLRWTSPEGLPPGGMSGRPLMQRSLQVVATIRGLAGPGPTIIGCGGVGHADDATAFLDAGADLVEAYTGFIYGGPGFCRAVLPGLER